jgi:hypothetical protein
MMFKCFKNLGKDCSCPSVSLKGNGVAFSKGRFDGGKEK